VILTEEAKTKIKKSMRIPAPKLTLGAGQVPWCNWGHLNKFILERFFGF
jgi:hypothetical protein